MRYKITLPLFFLFSIMAVAQKPKPIQSDSLSFAGQVFDRETLHVLSGAVYVVDETAYGCDEKGRFRLGANTGDTIIFRHVGYKDLILVVEDSLENEEFLTGIFLSPDMVELSEVLVVPRHYDLETLVRTTPIDYSEIQIAEKNMKMSAYQGLMPNSNWDAETNQKYAIQKEAMRIKYKGMVAPDQMVGVNLVTVLPEAILTYGPHDAPQMDLGAVTTQEQKYLTTVFDAIKKEKEKNKQVEKQNKVPLK